MERPVSDSAFDAENLGPVIVIMLGRYYDLLLGILSTLGEEGAEKAEALEELHRAGQTLSPPPSHTMGEK
jgi:hypothetical protein